MTVRYISAITLAVSDMARSVAFYRRLGFEPVYGGPDASFSSLRFDNAFVNLSAASEYRNLWWGRVIFRVDGVDAYHERLRGAGLNPERPRDAPWGERYFHLTDPDGHELSFAQLLVVQKD